MAQTTQDASFGPVFLIHAFLCTFNMSIDPVDIV